MQTPPAPNARAGLPPTEYRATVRGAPAFATLEVVLDAGQEICSNAGTLAYMREGVERGKLQASGARSFIGRFLGGQSPFLVKYKGLPGKGDRLVAFTAPLPGDMLRLDLKKGARVVVSRESYVAGSPSVKVTGKLNWRGFLELGQGEGGVLPELICEGDGGGVAWLGAYGAFQKHDLAAGQSLLVDNGLFLACMRASGQQAVGTEMYEIVKLGKTFVSSLFGGEGLGMKFTGPATVYTQSHNLNELTARIASRLPTSDGIGGGKRGGAAAREGVAFTLDIDDEEV